MASHSSKTHHQKRRRKSMDEVEDDYPQPPQGVLGAAVAHLPNVRTSPPVDSNLLTRTSWTDAQTALDQIRKGKATGNKASLWLRSKIQSELFKMGCFIQAHAGKVIFVGLLVLTCFCVGLKSATVEGRIEKLWVQEGGQLQRELKYVEDTLGYGAGSTSELLIQTPVGDQGSVLTPDALLTHLEILRNASKVVVEKHDVAWELKDLCYAPTIPATEMYMIDQILENLFPCAVITPLDCFWEGSKLLGPDVYVPLGSDEGSVLLSWSTLNPNKLVRQFRKFKDHFNFKSFEEFMKRAGIDSGYQEKPCLNPHDPNCPRSAPNKYSKQAPDIGSELTGGCYGFASRYMHWPEQLVVGGTTKNSTGHITRAKGLQSIVQLMGEKDLYDFHSDTYKVHAVDWSREYAAGVLREWQDKFSQEVQQLVKETRRGHKYQINAFSTSHLDAILQEFSEFSIEKVLIGCALMIAYAGVTMFRRGDLVRSQSGLGVAGVLLVILTIGPGLGLCALIGIHFNASTSHIVPYLALGLGVDSMFILAHSYAEQWQSAIPNEVRIGEVLKRTGMSVLLTGACNIAAFLAAAVIPIPALRAFALQAAILIAFNMASMLMVFPAVMALDLRRVIAGKMDLICCSDASPEETDEITDLDSVDPRRSRQSLNSNQSTRQLVNGSATPPPAYETVVEDGTGTAAVKSPSNEDEIDPPQAKFTLGWVAEKYYGPFVTSPFVKVVVVVAAIGLTGLGGWAVAGGVRDGLDLTEVVPRNTSVYQFLTDQKKYFGFYHMKAVTQGNFEYPQNQALVYDYQNAFVRIPNLIKNDDGGLPEFWLSLFREWLVKLQKAFDDDYARGHIWDRDPDADQGERGPGWDPEKASTDGVLAYKLLVQTGHVDYPVDETLLSRNRLVDAHGIINRNAFYNYLSAWYSNDAMAYSYSQANIVPTPKEWYHNADDFDLLVPKSQPIIYAQIPFYLNNLGDTEDMVAMIKQVRGVCKKFEDRGLPNFPAGVPFTFWEQYIGLRFWLGVAVASVLGAVFVAVSAVFVNAWLAGVVCIVVASIVIQLFGVMAVLDIHLSAIPAVIVILAVGIGVEFTLHICIGFVTSLGSRQHRVKKSLKHMFAPVFHGAFSTFLSVLMLEFSQFDFIVRYFFYVLTALIVLGVFNGLVFLPVLLVMIGPPPEVVPRRNNGSGSSNRIDPPSPEPSPAPVRSASFHHRQPNTGQHLSQSTQIGGASSQYATTGGRGKRGSGRSKDRLTIPAPAPLPQRHNSDLSLSTIAEESSFASQSSYHRAAAAAAPQSTQYPQHHHYPYQQYQPSPYLHQHHTQMGQTGSAPTSGQPQHQQPTSVFVEPHVVVETTTYPNSANSSTGGSLSRCSTPTGQVTKVTATAKFKVELHSSPQHHPAATPAAGHFPQGVSPQSSMDLGGACGGDAAAAASGRPETKRSRRKSGKQLHQQPGGGGLRVNLPPEGQPYGATGGLGYPPSSSAHSSLSNSVSSSLSSDGGFSEK